MGGVFISYSWKDNEKCHEKDDEGNNIEKDNAFVDRLYERLQGAGVRAWLDKHEMVAGRVKRQVVEALRVLDVVVLVLSEHSVESDWVEYELEAARKKEKAENRQVLCPVSLDDAWEGKMDNLLWRQVAKAFVVDFAKWREEAAFEESFGRLLKGMKIYYPGAK